MTDSNLSTTTSSNTTNLELDSSSLHYLHHSNNPSILLVSQPLIGDNHPTWSRAIIMAFKAKNKLGFIDVSISKPMTGSSYLPLWSRYNSMVLSWILNASSKEIMNSVIFLQIAQEVWQDLYIHFSQHNAPHIFKIQHVIANNLQHNNSIATYYTGLKVLWDELTLYNFMSTCTYGVTAVLYEIQ